MSQSHMVFDREGWSNLNRALVLSCVWFFFAVALMLFFPLSCCLFVSPTLPWFSASVRLCLVLSCVLAWFHLARHQVTDHPRQVWCWFRVRCSRELGGSAWWSSRLGLGWVSAGCVAPLPPQWFFHHIIVAKLLSVDVGDVCRDLLAPMVVVI